MTRQGTLDGWPAFDRAPITHLGQLAQQLIGKLEQEKSHSDTVSWALLSKVVNFAAEAEHQLNEKLQRIAELEALSTTDELTGLANRRGLEDFLDRTLASVNRHKDEGVVIYIDLDDFKHINDDYGHAAGDATLKAVAANLKQATRASDLVARPGGDEFVAVLTRCPASEAADQTARIQKGLTRLRVRYGRRIIPVSASCGFAVFGPGSHPSDLLEQADEMMYEDKATKSARRHPSAGR